MNKVLNNEVMIFGKLLRTGKQLKINNHDAIQLLLNVQDDNYKDKTNIVVAYAYTNNKRLFNNYLNKEIGINGHIITQMGTKVIIDAITLA